MLAAGARPKPVSPSAMEVAFTSPLLSFSPRTTIVSPDFRSPTDDFSVVVTGAPSVVSTVAMVPETAKDAATSLTGAIEPLAVMLLDTAPSFTVEVSGVAEAELAERRLLSALAKLDREQRALLALQVEGYTVAELTAMTDLSADVLKARLYRARVRLGKLLAADGKAPTLALVK